LLLRHDLRPIVGGLELSILRHDAVDSFESPSPYELHLSEMWADDVRRGGAGPHGIDPDLAAHTAMARSRGIALVAPEPATALGEVRHAAFRSAVLDDARSITGAGIIESPFYGVLNLCRCLQLALDAPAEPATKDEGAGWAVGALSVEHRPLIEMALDCSHSAADVPPETRRVHGHAWDRQPRVDFASYARENLKDARR
jgi:streptomycin 3"-adenylyltransferase